MSGAEKFKAELFHRITLNPERYLTLRVNKFRTNFDNRRSMQLDCLLNLTRQWRLSLERSRFVGFAEAEVSA